MYESYYGFAEKPFSLTPDPKYLYRSESLASAFELLLHVRGELQVHHPREVLDQQVGDQLADLRGVVAAVATSAQISWA